MIGGNSFNSRGVSMKRKIVITGLCLFVLVSTGCQKINTTSAPALAAEGAKENDATGKTVAAAKSFLATLDEAGRVKVSFAFNSGQVC